MCWIKGYGWLGVFLLAFWGCTRPVGPQVDSETANELMLQGQAYLDQGLTDSALAAFGMALEADPGLVDAHMNMGAIYQQHGQLELAGRCYERAVTADPNHFDARYFYGWMQHLQGHIQKAIDSYLRALAIQPDSFDANLNISGAYLQAGKVAEAMPYASLATQLKPDSQTAWANLATAHSLLNQFEDAVRAYHQAMELGDMAPPILMGLANAHVQLGHFEQAIVVLKILTTDRSADAKVYQRLGYAQFKMRRFEDALDSFRASIEIDDQDPAALNGIGVCLMAMYLQEGRGVSDHRDQALDAWRRSLQLRPNQPHIVDLLSRYQRL